MKKIIHYISFFRKVKILQFFYLNYLCKSIIRTDKSKIIPYKNAVVEISKKAKVYLGDGDIEIGCDKLRRSKAETLIRIKENAVWSSLEGCKISYGATIELLENALLDSRYFTLNSNSVIVIANQVKLGHDVMIGRNVVMYDSDHHQILDSQGQLTNEPREIEIDDHVWLASNVLVLKNAKIGMGSIIGAQTVVKGNVEEHSLYQNDIKLRVKNQFGRWEREKPSQIEGRKNV